MPYLKQIAAHTNCQAIQRYLEKRNRALAKDFFNLSVDERDGYGDEDKDIRWADEMDATRRAFGNDTPFGAMRARTYKHFIISPDPEDGIDLEALRELAKAWALEHFADFQVAIVYHDDNASRIPHAHIVVNNTNLETGKRLHHDDPKELNRSLQKMAKERELLFFSEAPEPAEGLERLAVKERGREARPKTMQQVHIGRVERELAEAGSYSWVADIRNRVSVAKSLARNVDEFAQLLRMLGVDIAGNSRNARRDDWVFSLSDAPARRVSGERLGLLFSKETIQRQLARAGSYHPDAKSSRELLRNARNAILVNDLEDLSDLSRALRVCAYHNVSTLRDCDARLAVLQRRTETSAGRQRNALETRIAELEFARDYMATRNLLPERIETRRAESAQSRIDTRPAQHERNSIEKQTEQARRIERHQRTATERNER